MDFTVGQIVELDTTGFVPSSGYEMGDRGTIIDVGGPGYEPGPKVSWHRTGQKKYMTSWRLRVYVNPMDAPGRAKGSLETMQALRVVLQEEETHAMEEVRQDLERARMTAEDLRGALRVYEDKTAKLMIGHLFPTRSAITVRQER